MLTVERSPQFLSILGKVRNKDDLEKIKKHIRKIIENPEIGKPMRFSRKGTREVYVGSFRLSYALLKDKQKLVFLEVYQIVS